MTWNKKKDEAHKPADDAAQSSDTKHTGTAQTTGKGHPTPKRKDAQAQNLHPLVPVDRKASAKAAKARIRAKEDAQYEAMRTGDINNMPKSERLPWRVYIRDYVDARFNIGEFFVPVAVIILIASMVMSVTVRNVWTTIVPMVLLYAYLAAVIIDVAVMWHKLKRKLIEKYGEASVAKGTRSASYAWSRAIQLRRWRLPKPRYDKRGHWPE